MSASFWSAGLDFVAQCVLCQAMDWRVLQCDLDISTEDSKNHAKSTPIILKC